MPVELPGMLAACVRAAPLPVLKAPYNTICIGR